MRLYDLKTGTNTRRVRIFLAEKGVKLPTVEVDMLKGENKSPDYLSKILWERCSPRTNEWNENRRVCGDLPIYGRASPRPALFGTTPIERALIEMWKSANGIRVG